MSSKRSKSFTAQPIEQGQHDSGKVLEAQGFSSPTVYEIIAEEGLEEMRRPAKSLWFSGVVAGLAISLSLYVMAALRVEVYQGQPGVLEKLGYCVGFLVVVLSRLQLFTENTITPILSLFKKRDPDMLLRVSRLWLIVFLANIVGTFIAAAIPLLLPVFPIDYVNSMLAISMHFVEKDATAVFFSAIPAGFMVAAMVWMLPNAKNAEFWVITVMTFAIAVTDTSHVIVGSTELFMAWLSHQANTMHILQHLFLAGAGNIVGGTVLFAGLAYAQVSDEI